MGKCASKEDAKENLQCRDWKFVEKTDHRAVKYLNIWIEKFEFDGSLNTQKLTDLRGIQTATKKCPTCGIQTRSTWMGSKALY